MTSVPRFITTFIPTHYDLSLTLEREARTFSGVATISGSSTGGHISLHSKDLTVENVLVDGHAATFTHGDNDELRLTADGLTAGDHVIVIHFSGIITDAMHGLYPCYYEHAGSKQELLATQFESHHAREVFPCVDEPEAKATFDLTLTTERVTTVLSNQPIDWQREEAGKLITAFQTTPRMSTYLLAWVTGDLHRKTATTKDGVEVNVWATLSQRPEALDFALEHAVKSIEFFDEYFGTPYPLAKSDHVALPDFSSGAMENWGLITYREIALLADPATTTVASKQYIATVISHELSHQWFGNLVTMKWWNNLWLNESFATLMEYIAVDAIHPEWNAWLDFATHESILALRRDAIEGVQAVQVEVNHPDEISSLFDGAIVYAKGARLMRMCQNYIGNKAFREGLAGYFKEFAYQNTEADDLWRHLSAASGKDIAALMNTWISQSGYPVVHVTPDGLRQERFFIGTHEPSGAIWPIPLDAEGEEDMPTLMETPQLDLPVSNDERLNTRDASHFITHYTPEHLAKLLAKLTTLNEIGRLQLLHEQTLLARGSITSSTTLIDLLQAYQHETAQSVWDIMALAFAELKKFIEQDEEAERKLRNFAYTLTKDQFDRLGWEPKHGEPESDTKLRSLVIGLMLYSEDSTTLAYCRTLFTQGVEKLDPEIRHLIISAVVKNETDITIVENLLKLYRKSQSADLREDIASGITSVKQSKAITLLTDTFTNKNVIRQQDLFRWFVYMIRNRHARTATWEWMKQHWEWIESTFAGDKSYDDFPRYAASGLSTREQLEDYIAFFTPKRNIPALTRTIDLGIKEIQAKVTLIEQDGAAVTAQLKAL
jgi:aminopeptidase N